MCGIIAYIGRKNNAAKLSLEGLKKLEYRGYDSWGVCWKKLKNHGNIEIIKRTGKIGELDIKNIEFSPAKIAMAHSRWATHGKVTEKNAHPHFTENKRIAIIHNGIIENYLELKEKLKNHKFNSETDTEIAAHLIESYLPENQVVSKKDFIEATMKALQELQGRYAFIVMCKDINGLIAARRGSPLIIGKGKNEYFIASDIPAFLDYTNKVIYLDDEQMAIIDDHHEFFKIKNGEPLKKRIVKIDWKAEEAKLGKFPHFMLKEILEQKDTIIKAIEQSENDIKKIARAIKNAYGTYLVGCGTAGRVAMAGAYMFSKIAKRHVNFAFGSEFSEYKNFIGEKSLVIAISQSGETADTLEAIEAAKKCGAKVLSIINVPGSTMERISDLTIHIKAGPEKAVASTKATTSQLAILLLLAYACINRLKEGKKLLLETGSDINDMVNPRYEAHILKLAKKLKREQNIYVIGRGLNYPMALEAAIKLQEVSYIHAEGFAGGELKHGPIALISEKTPCICFAPNDETKQDILSNATEIKSRGGYIIGISPNKEEIFDFWIKVPDCGAASIIPSIIPVQILAYQLAVLRKNNPDMPRNLAKSVTVK